MDEQQYRSRFKLPDSDFWPGAYWFWQYIPSKKEIDDQLKEILAAGYHTFYIQPRLAFPIEQYLSQAYLEAYRYAIQEASKLGLSAGIYDDYNWNSGHAGGLTVKNHDEFRERQLFWTSTVINSRSFTLEISGIDSLMGDKLGGRQGQWTYEGGKPLWDDWKVIRAVTFAENTQALINIDYNSIIEHCEIIDSGAEKCTITIHLPDDKLMGRKVTVFVAGRCKTSRHINYLNKAATTRFIEVGYEPYKKAVGEYFGSTVFCMFMDHPHAGFYTWDQQEGNIANTLMYDDSLPEFFLREHNYPIENAWLSFILQESEETPKLRGDFFDTYGKMAREFFLSQISEWAHKNGLQFAGHELFGFLGIWGFYGGYHVVDQRTDFGGDYFGIGRFKDISTVDAYNSNPQIDAKVGDSVAREAGKHGCLLEQYYYCEDPNYPGAIGHWNLTLDEMRTQAIRHTLFGSRQFIFHGFYLSDKVGGNELLASSKFDFAPGINFEPWFKYNRLFSNELSRLSAFIYNADPVADTALMYPLSTYWVEGADGILGHHSAIWNQWLLEHGVGYDIVDENRITFDPANPGKIIVGPNQYSILILPGVRYLRNKSLVSSMLDFMNTGGTLVLSGATPKSLIEGDDIEISDLFKQIIKYPGVHFFPDENDLKQNLPLLKELFFSENPLYHISQNLVGKIWIWTGKVGGGYSVAIFNESDEKTSITIKLPVEVNTTEKWDLRTGNIVANNDHLKIKEISLLSLDVNPREVCCYRLVESPLTDENLTPEEPHENIANPSNQDFSPALYAAGINERFRANSTTTLNLLADETNKINRITLNNVWELKIPEKNWVKQIDIEMGWETHGLDNFSGEAIYETRFSLPIQLDGTSVKGWILEFPRISVAAEVILNDYYLGSLPWPPYMVFIPQSILKSEKNYLLVKVVNTAGNQFYSDSPYQVPNFPSGIIGAPVLIPIQKMNNW